MNIYNNEVENMELVYSLRIDDLIWKFMRLGL